MSKNRQYQRFEIGTGSYGFPIIIGSGAKLTIGKYCSIGPDVSIILDSSFKRPSFGTTVITANTHKHIGTFADVPQYSDVTIGNDVWIGLGSVIMPGVTLNDGCVIGAKSFVVSDVPPYAIVMGTPARVVKYRFSEENIRIMQNMKWWDWPYEKIITALPHILTNDITTFIARYNDVRTQSGDGANG
jgi:acetyltransferase-like isoleucine patch superfamily enzyme